MNSLISVIVPVYNVEKYLERCVDSLLGQSYENLEIILVDDGSTDLSGVICDQYANSEERVKVIHQQYQGVSDARNKGIKLAKGEYYIFLDSDDEAHPDYVLKLYQVLCENELDIAQCCLLRVKNGKYINQQETKEDVQIFSGMEMQMRIFERNKYFTMCLCGKLFKRGLFEGLEFPVGRINEDESLIYILMYRANRVGVIDDYLYFYHYNSESITEKRYNIHRLDCFYMLREKFDFYKNLGLYSFADKTASEYFSQMAIVLTREKREMDDYDMIMKRAKEIYKHDRLNMLKKAKLPTIKRVFYGLSCISFNFVKVYGLMLKKYLEVQNI